MKTDYYRPAASTISHIFGPLAANQIEQNTERFRKEFPQHCWKYEFCPVCEEVASASCRMCSEKFCGQHVYESGSGEKLCADCDDSAAAQVPEQADPSIHPHFAGYR
jgi:hypothetical protein